MLTSYYIFCRFLYILYILYIFVHFAYFLGDDYAYIVCVHQQPRIQYCGDGTIFDPQVLTCVYLEPPHLGGAPHLGGPPPSGFGPFN